MGLTGAQGAYNLLEEKWIPVLYTDGKTDRIGIWQALTEAGKIRQIAASNPMDWVSLLRFLLAVLMWCKKDAKSSLAALDKESTGVPEDWLAKLKENKDAFNLLGEGKRFYQNESLKNENSRPISDLLFEFPGEDSVNHIYHIVHDNSYGLCPACCAMGILRFSVWAPANRFYSASVNPGSAAYALIEGKNLFQILGANLPETNPQSDQAPWLSDEPPDSPDAVALLAWRPRMLWLNVAGNSGLCAYCGQTGTLIKNLCIKDGWPRPITMGQQFGKDVQSESKELSGDSNKEEQSQLGQEDTQKKKFWPEDPHLLKRTKPIKLPGLNESIDKHASMFWREVLRLRGTKVVAIGIVGGTQYIFYDTPTVRLPDVSDDVKRRAELSAKCSSALPGLLKEVTKKPQQQRRRQQHVEICLIPLIPHAEAQIRDRLKSPHASTGKNASEEKAFLYEVYAPVVEQVIASVIAGSPLRRCEAKHRAQVLLENKIKELVENSDRPSHEGISATAQVKQKRSRKKETKT